MLKKRSWEVDGPLFAPGYRRRYPAAITQMKYLILFILFCAFCYTGSKSERAAIRRRTARLGSRDPVDFSCWTDAIPNADPDAIKRILAIIGAELSVAPEFLRPHDGFGKELTIKDKFWSFVSDDDFGESIADQFISQYDYEPTTFPWVDLRQVVMETWKAVHDAG